MLAGLIRGYGSDATTFIRDMFEKNFFVNPYKPYSFCNWLDGYLRMHAFNVLGFLSV